MRQVPNVNGHSGAVQLGSQISGTEALPGQSSVTAGPLRHFQQGDGRHICHGGEIPPNWDILRGVAIQLAD